MRFNHLPDVKFPDSRATSPNINLPEAKPSSRLPYEYAGIGWVRSHRCGYCRCCRTAIRLFSQSSRGWKLREDGNVMEEEIAASREYQNPNPPSSIEKLREPRSALPTKFLPSQKMVTPLIMFDLSVLSFVIDFSSAQLSVPLSLSPTIAFLPPLIAS